MHSKQNENVIILREVQYQLSTGQNFVTIFSLPACPSSASTLFKIRSRKRNIGKYFELPPFLLHGKFIFI